LEERHIIFFFAQKMYYLERVGRTEAYNRLIDLFEQINLDGLLNYLTRYYSVDISRELDDFSWKRENWCSSAAGETAATSTLARQPPLAGGNRRPRVTRGAGHLWRLSSSQMASLAA
jgi:hypothetical protein